MRNRPQRIFDFEAAKPAPYRPHPMLRVEESGLQQAAELIRNAKRPIILAGHGVSDSGAMEQIRTLAERAQIPVALTLLGLGGIPCVASAQPRHDGHARRSVGQPRHSGSRPSHRLRHALRRSRHRHSLATYALKAKKIHIEVDPCGDQQEHQGRRRTRRRSARGARRTAAAHLRTRRLARGSRPSNPARARWRCATSRIYPTPAISTPRT